MLLEIFQRVAERSKHQDLAPGETVKKKEELASMAVPPTVTPEGYALLYAGEGVFYLDSEAVPKTALESEFLTEIIPAAMKPLCRIIISSSPYVRFEENGTSVAYCDDGQALYELKMRVNSVDNKQMADLQKLNVIGVMNFGARSDVGSNYRAHGDPHHGIEMAVYTAQQLCQYVV